MLIVALSRSTLLDESPQAQQGVGWHYAKFLIGE
jgi:hypothetical protein